jgi:tetratricopeptide (TPR) repeat protein
MLLSRKSAVVFFAGVLLLMTGCARTARFPLVRPSPEPARHYFSSVRAENLFVQALDYDRRGLAALAEQCYALAYELDPRSEILKNILLNRYVGSGKYTQALLLVRSGKKERDLTEDDRRSLAGIYLKMGQYQRAIDMLESLKEKKPDELYSLGLIYETLGLSDKSLRCYRQCYEQSPSSLQLGLKVAGLLTRKGAYADAESLYVRMEQRFPESPAIINGLGLMYMIKGDTALALDYFKTSATLDTAQEDPLRYAAQIYLSRSDYVRAIACYEKLYQESGPREIYGKTLALLYYYNKQPEKAEELLKHLLSENIDDYELHFYMGLVAAVKSDTAGAEMEYRKALALRRTYADPWQQLVYIYIRQNKLDTALSEAKKFCDLQPASSQSWRLVGHVRAVRKEFADAVKSLGKAVAIDSTDAGAWFDLGSACERQHDIAGAADAFRKVLALRPDDPSTCNYLGYMWAEQGMQLDSAQVLLERALGAEPENGAFLDSYAWVYYQKGDFDKALLYMRKAIRNLSNDPIVYEHLGDILMKKNDAAGSREAYLKSILLHPEDPGAVQKKIDKLQNQTAP